MRINKYVARATGMSRRAADSAVSQGRVTLNGSRAETGSEVNADDKVTLDGSLIALPDGATVILLNKPAGYVCSRAGQGSQTIYELLPPDLQRLKPVGRLDKDSSGLLLLTDDGELANRLTHPSYGKEKTYEVLLDGVLTPEHKRQLDTGVELADGPSRLHIKDSEGRALTVTMSEGRNRQIRRTFEALGYEVVQLHRINFGDYSLGNLQPGQYRSP